MAGLKHVRVAVDIGGTFTDGIAVDEETGRVDVAKALTTPDDPGLAVGEVIGDLIARLADGQAGVASRVSEIVHGTTLVTNALIARRGARSALLVTRGMRDALEIRRELRYHLYDLNLQLPEPLTPPSLRFEIDERCDAHGRVLVSPDRDAVAAVARELRAAGVESVAVCFLHAYLEPKHERLVGSWLKTMLPDIPVTLSSDIVREVREYERMTTTVANAYTRPLMARYLHTLETRVRDLGVRAPLRIMLSNGGFTSAAVAASVPIALLESGPAAGVISAAHAALELGDATRVLAFDMGGTTAKAAVVIDGQPNVTHSFEAARVARFRRGSGLPVLVTSLDLIEIGAGGGSIAHTGALGTLAVGPQSAEGRPGPACYGRGGTELTVTDADLLLGYIDPAAFLGGRMTLDVRQAEIVAGALGRQIGCDPIATAVGVREVVDESMAAAARVHIAERGYDPRDFVLVATGGAGPVHAVSVARKLGIGRILCPIAAGAGSCLGLLAAPARAVRSVSRECLLSDYDPVRIAGGLRELGEQIESELRSAGSGAGEMSWQLEADMHFAGQGHSVSVPLAWTPSLAGPPAASIRAAFLAEYQRVFGPAPNEAAAIRIAGWRLSGIGRRSAGRAFFRRPDADDQPVAQQQRRIWDQQAGGFALAPVVMRSSLSPGCRLQGPLVIQEDESTLVVPVPASVSMLPSGAILVDISES